MTMDDFTAWNRCPADVRWVFDKLLLSTALGHVCGPVGMDVPEPGEYVVRPCVNLMGMGREAEVRYIERSTEDLPIGHFWCEKFEGIHTSVDYKYGVPQLIVCGARQEDDPLYKWRVWYKLEPATNYAPPYPSILSNDLPHVNCEFIGNKLIEVHLRPNPDFSGATKDASYLLVVWDDMDETPPDNHIFIADPDFKRKGFFVLDK